MLQLKPVNERPQVICFPAGIGQVAAIEGVIDVLPQVAELEQQCIEYRNASLTAASSINPIRTASAWLWTA